jgi:hypothetical protein
MKTDALAASLLRDIQEHLATGKRKKAEQVISKRLQEIFEQTVTDELIIQVDLNCGEFKAAWISAPVFDKVTVVITEDPSVAENSFSDLISVDDDRAIINVVDAQLMDNVSDVAAAIDEFNE